MESICGRHGTGMIELSELFVRTSRGKIHRAMTDSENNVYAWKQCRLATSKVETFHLDKEVMANADETSFCQICVLR